MHPLFSELFFVLWFFLPAGLANVTPIFIAKIHILSRFTYPMDFYQTYKGKRIFGENKTIRGFIFGLLAAILTVLLQQYFYNTSDPIKQLIQLDYTTINPFLFGSLSAFGALLGDAIKSFFKRQANIVAGKLWFPFDQIDYILGGILFTSFYISLSLWEYLLLILVWFIIHIVSTNIGFLLKLKTSPM